MKILKKQIAKTLFSYVLISHTIIGYALPLNNSILNASTTPIVVGSFSYQYPLSNPLILVGDDHGKSWSFVKNIVNLPSNRESSITAVNCIATNCVAVGSYTNDIRKSSPLILTSRDKGQSWSFMDKVIGIPSNYAVSLYTVACAGNTCLAGGMADNYDGGPKRHFFPLLLESKDSGKSWSLVQGGLFYLQSKDGVINQITRSGNNWIVAGYYHYYEFPYLSFRQMPFLLLSKDGILWSSYIKNYGLSSSISNGGLDTITCSNNICLAGGWGGSEDADGLPLILKTDNNGESWSAMKNISGFPHSSTADNPNLAAFSCSDNACVAVGNWWTSESPNGVPLILVSHDKGESWTTIETIAGLPSNLKYPWLSTVYCSNSTCLTGGYFERGGNPTGLPLLLISKDNGLSWSLVKNISGLPANFKDARISSITCSDRTCIAIGGWSWQSNEKTYPLLLISNDMGESWTFMQNIIGLPSNIESGWLSASHF